MRIFQDTLETRKQSFISAFSICMTVTLKYCNFKASKIPWKVQKYRYRTKQL